MFSEDLDDSDFFASFFAFFYYERCSSGLSVPKCKYFICIFYNLYVSFERSPFFEVLVIRSKYLNWNVMIFSIFTRHFSGDAICYPLKRGLDARIVGNSHHMNDAVTIRSEHVAENVFQHRRRSRGT